MVRINLLPDRKQTNRMGAAGEPAQVWMVVIFALLLVEVIGLMFWQKMLQDDLADSNRRNSLVDEEIAKIDSQMATYPKVLAELKELRDQEQAIQKLEDARGGPTATLLELSRVLTTGRGPTTIAQQKEGKAPPPDAPTSAFNPTWDPHRLWLSSYNEVDRAVKMTGLARDGEDVSELEKRLAASDYFYDVKLLPGAKTTDDITHQEVVKFELRAKVRY